MHIEMTPDSPCVEVLRPAPAVALIVLHGEHDLATAPELQRAIDEALADCSQLIVDLSAAEFIDSTTIAALMKAKKQADNAGRAFNVVLGRTPIVQRALEISGVLPSLNRVTSLEQALTPAASPKLVA